jgi:hypothetical protein
MMEFVNGKDDIPYMKWKIKFRFQTTNQYIYVKGSFLPSIVINQNRILKTTQMSFGIGVPYFYEPLLGPQ